MSTGGLALLLSPATQPHPFPGLNTIGKVVHIIDLVLFSAVTLCITYRFSRYRGTLQSSLTHPTESLFSATALLSLASIIAGMARYAIPVCGPWLVVVYRVLFWTYFAITFLSAVGHYGLLFTSPLLKIQDMTPAWDLPIFPFMLCGTIAASGAQFQPPNQAVPMILGGLTAQGLGFIISILMYASYIRRMVQFGFPGPNLRPAMFIAVGPPSFTSLAILGMANAWPKDYHNFFGANLAIDNAVLDSYQQQLIAIQIMRVLATMTAVFTWSLSFWFFCIAVLACLLGSREMTFHLNWWAFVFPNIGFTIATSSIGKVFQSQGVLWMGNVMTILLIVTYLFVGVMHIRAVVTKQILWPGRDEDIYTMVRQAKQEKIEKTKSQSQSRVHSNAINGDIEKQD